MKKISNKILIPAITGAILFGSATAFTVTHANDIPLLQQKGWVEESGTKRFYKDGKALTGKVKINNNFYMFNRDGDLETGFVNYKGSLYFYDKSGKMHVGYLKGKNSYYYFNNNGHAVTGFRKGNGFTEYYGPNHLQYRNKSLKDVADNKIYFFNKNGDQYKVTEINSKVKTDNLDKAKQAQQNQNNSSATPSNNVASADQNSSSTNVASADQNSNSNNVVSQPSSQQETNQQSTPIVSNQPSKNSTSNSSTANNANSNGATNNSQPAPTSNVLHQVVAPNVNTFGQPGLCLGYVDNAFRISSGRSYSAKVSSNKAIQQGTMHFDGNFPEGVMVPVYWNLVNKSDGVNYGHIAIWDGHGGFYWEGNNNSTPNHLTLSEINDIFANKRPVNGRYLGTDWQPAQLIGWSTTLENTVIASK